MIETHGTEFTTPTASHPQVGFHGTTSAASAVIEIHGFLPSKVFSEQEHIQILQLVKDLGWDAGSYQQWLDMRSVSFANDPKFAIHHVTQAGKAGGQGLFNVREALEFILSEGSIQSKAIAQTFRQRLDQLRAADPVIYMVDLSGLGPRLVSGNTDYNMYWDPCAALPNVSEIGPGRIIEKLVFATSR